MEKFDARRGDSFEECLKCRYTVRNQWLSGDLMYETASYQDILTTNN